MSDMGDDFRELNKRQQAKRAANRQSSTQILTAAGVVFESKNGGAHLIIDTNDGYIDFWPGTGLWKVRSDGRKGRGVQSLLDLFSLSLRPHSK